MNMHNYKTRLQNYKGGKNVSTADVFASICEALEFGRYLRIFVAKETKYLSSVLSGMFLLVLLLLDVCQEKKSYQSSK